MENTREYNEKKVYTTPEMSVLDVCYHGILCNSDPEHMPWEEE